MAEAERMRTLLDLLRWRVKRSAESPALIHAVGAEWHPMSWAELDRASSEIASGLLSLGLPLGTRVGLLARSRLEWTLADLGILKAGCCTVPLHANSLDAQVQHVLDDSGALAILVENESQLAKVRCASCYHNLHHVVVMRGPTRGPTELSWSELLAAGRAHQAEFPETLAARRRAVEPSSLASIVYTSGTTGMPKGAMLTHANLVFEAESLAEVMRGSLGSGDVHLLCLPLSHILARIMVLAGISTGYANAFSTGPDSLEREFGEVRPTFVTVVPAILEQLHTAIRIQSEERGFAGRQLFQWARSVGEQVARRRSSFEPLPLGLGAKRLLAEQLLGPLVHERFGGRLKFFICGGAPLSTDVVEYFQSLGLLVLEGYGLTENVGAANVNRPDRYRFGTVGPPIPGVEERIAEDGEILIRGPNVMQGYYGLAAESALCVDEGGWLHTGDTGVFEEGGFLRVTGRIKDLIVTSMGKNVAPQHVEKILRTSAYIDQVMVCGDGRRYLTALISLDAEQIQHFAERQGLAFDRIEELACHPAVRRLLRDEIDACNRRLASWETVRDFTILPAPLSLDAGEITPTMKLRRQEVEARYRDLIDAMYAEKPAGSELASLEGP
ncbi:MAG: long-chain fatty acid--CoA ligase [Deltaproteobacteria bacterium]|nr:long-chain fatty acid--CoA ligase [Deltaproteobacteria bacterium]